MKNNNKKRKEKSDFTIESATYWRVQFQFIINMILLLLY